MHERIFLRRRSVLDGETDQNGLRRGPRRLFGLWITHPHPRPSLWMGTFYHPRDLWIGTFYHPRSHRSITHACFVLSPTRSLVFINPDNGLQNLNPRARS